MDRTIDRTRPPYRDDPVIARLTDEQVWALAAVLLRLAESEAGRIAAANHRPDDDADLTEVAS